ncbi:type II secretion system protein [Shewanella pneumatophori]|uniref:Type II secretion system GspH family protein n=1 Tax=Shewanella pneumatophori TaxID=314092 RepID=A0A9X1ZBQ6_9GAMM|nr:type II secretion system protein [Shewanella pneumatophori]MCL1139314.1 type II secretion system GspH family protein [Shewanella pneumatophori]
MQKQNGFTLIELVVVIIILGILAVTAAPKFINLQSDARASALQGVKGAIQGANGLVFAKSALAGKEKSSTATAVEIGTDSAGDPVEVQTIYGYLLATETDFEKAMDVDFDTDPDTKPEWVIELASPAAGQVTIYQLGAPSDGATCNVVYTQAKSTSEIPTYVITETGC